ncbi:PREDICTED: LOW QUALITY PROTEIN: glutamate receptor 1.4-like [Prunus mume]|uniref:Glutamate receptor n=1 Tax=Prunus mume TaxID=102107 RepID=A0ABM1LYM2_PRUMU|nr:PREDICTED: LOW QUALITY PROTEIN: glutamate receptor 1.4-like [Prunus mume]
MEFQEKKQIILCLSFVTLFGLLGLLCAEIDGSPNIVVEEVHVGVILDMGSREGKIILSCISTSLSDFYHLHNNYSTRVILHTRDSKGKALHALSAALNLLDKIKVEAIIGAQTRMEANLLAELGEEAKVPVLSLSGLRTSPFGAPGEYPFFVEITQDETSQVTAISGLIEMFKWRAVILLYENTDYGRDIIPFFINSIEEANVTIVYKSCIAASSADEQIIEELRNLTKLKTTVFVVHVSHFLVPRLFLNAKKLGLLSEGYAWIMTSTSMNFLHSSMDPSVIDKYTCQHIILLSDPKIVVNAVTPDGIWAYNATWTLAEAVERTWTSTGLNLVNLNNITSSKHGLLLLQEILQTRFKGLSGEEIQYPNGKLVSTAIEIVNVIGKGERRVGLWPCEEKHTRDSYPLNNRRNLLSTNNLETIIWPGGSSTIPRGSKMQLSNSSKIKLRVGVPVRIGFNELVHMKHDNQTNRTYFSGFCIDVFETAIRALPYEVNYTFIPFPVGINESYNDLVYQVFLQTFDAVVGDTTITSERSQNVCFTIPYTDLGVGMLVSNENKGMWFFLKPLSADLWITSAVFFILTGFVVWVIERPVNPEFQGAPSQQIGTILCFAFSTLVYAHREKLLNNLAKFVVIVWGFAVLIFTSSYTATLTSIMTVNQIQLNSRGNIGYHSLISRQGVDIKFKRSYKTVEEYALALSRGSKHGGVSAIVDEVPYIKIFLGHYPTGYSMIKPESTTNGFGFVFPKGSKLVHDISMQIQGMREEGKLIEMEKVFPKGSKLVHDMSRQIEHMREEGKLIEMEKTWSLRKTTLMSEEATTTGPSTLDLYSFRGLFLVTGISSAFALFLFLIFSTTFRNLIRKQLQLIGRQLQRLRM